MSHTQSSFPFYPWRLVLLVLAWNALVLADRELLGYRVVGPLGLVALAALTILFLSLSLSRLPGSWFLRRLELGRVFRWLCLYLAVGTVLLFVAGTVYLLQS
jgi:hypothetical protein